MTPQTIQPTRSAQHGIGAMLGYVLVFVVSESTMLTQKYDK